jgi:leucyl/phenylalanyl-tRNA---protein transferase
LRRWLRTCDWTIAADRDFAGTMRACAAPRRHQPTTWITTEMLAAYQELHALGHAHSIEIYAGEELVGGIYGVTVGRMFFGESMFSARTNGSKVALIALCRGLREWQFPLIDAQVSSPHLTSMGAREMSRNRFTARVAALSIAPGVDGSWAKKWPLHAANELA